MCIVPLSPLYSRPLLFVGSSTADDVKPVRLNLVDSALITELMPDCDNSKLEVPYSGDIGKLLGMSSAELKNLIIGSYPLSSMCVIVDVC